ncbi:MAG: alpha-E domain-containing protein [Halobacteriales archaeon]|nr:alpha-E domain-containing protein [Halobacteriales archaeon]
MLSRAANAIYWMTRYIERAENVARFIDVNLNVALDVPESNGMWDSIVATTGDEASFRERHGTAAKSAAIHFLAAEPTNPNAIVSCLYHARENARSVREIISSEMWLQVNTAYLAVQEAIASGQLESQPHEFFARVKLDSHLFDGLMEATMSHGEPWHFGRLGRLLERADKTARMLDVKYYALLPRPSDLGAAFDDLQWSAVLRSASALEMYRKRRHRITAADVADFLVFDRDFPRSIGFCLNRAEESLKCITGSAPGTFSNVAEKRLGRLRSHVEYLDIQDVFTMGLHEFLQETQTDLNYVGDGIHETFFAMRPLAPEPGGVPQ